MAEPIKVAPPFVHLASPLHAEPLEISAYAVVWMRPGVQVGETHVMLASGEQIHVTATRQAIRAAMRKAMGIAP